MGLGNFFSKILTRKKKSVEIVEEIITETLPLSELLISDFLEYEAVDFIFPQAFSVSNVPIRVRSTYLKASSNAFDPNFSGLWFYMKADTAFGKIGVYFCLSTPPLTLDAATNENIKKTVSAIAHMAAFKIKEKLEANSAFVSTNFVSGPCPVPSLAGKSSLAYEFSYSVRGVFREGRAYTSFMYPNMLLKAFGLDVSSFTNDPIRALSSASSFLTKNNLETIWSSRMFKYKTLSGERLYLPVYELFNILKDLDLRLILQNNILPKLNGISITELLLYIENQKTEQGFVRRAISPHSFDEKRLSPLFPLLVLEEGLLNAKNASENVESFLALNDIVYENLFKATKNGSLELSPLSIRLIQDIYLKLVFSEKRKRFDKYILDGDRLAEIFALKENIIHRTVDTSSAKSLAALLYGRKDYLAHVIKYCSKRKKDEIAEEMKRIETGLEEGFLNFDLITRERQDLWQKALTLKDVKEEDLEIALEYKEKRRKI